MHMSCQRENSLSKQTRESATSEWTTGADALNVSFVATRGTGVRLSGRGVPGVLGWQVGHSRKDIRLTTKAAISSMPHHERSP